MMLSRLVWMCFLCFECGLSQLLDYPLNSDSIERFLATCPLTCCSVLPSFRTWNPFHHPASFIIFLALTHLRTFESWSQIDANWGLQTHCLIIKFPPLHFNY